MYNCLYSSVWSIIGIARWLSGQVRALTHEVKGRGLEYQRFVDDPPRFSTLGYNYRRFCYTFWYRSIASNKRLHLHLPSVRVLARQTYAIREENTRNKRTLKHSCTSVKYRRKLDNSLMHSKHNIFCILFDILTN